VQKIITFLTFNDQAEEAVNFYVSVFDNSQIKDVRRYGEEGPGPEGSLMSATFELEGQEFRALNGGPSFKFDQGISLFVSCETQEEVDELWARLTDGGAEGPCGWLTDRFGVSWQVIPTVLADLLDDPDPSKARSTMEAMLKMRKIDIEALEKAHAEA
jgi:predicted 3-demethylubiquinone-9 3-methyltransferase (glyoxalase superfamily)